MGFKKAFKKLRKSLGIPAVTLGNVAKVGAAVATGGVGAGAALLGTQALKSKLKSAGAQAGKVLRSKAEKALAKRVAKAMPLGGATAKPRAQTMPGGAPLTRPVKRTTKRAVTKRRKASNKGTNQGQKPKSARKAPPKGGKDLKALSASWKAAGKPGKWIDWVKSH